MYHSVQDDPSAQSDTLGGIIHSTEVFRGQMEVIARHFNPVNLEDAPRKEAIQRPKSKLQVNQS